MIQKHHESIRWLFCLLTYQKNSQMCAINIFFELRCGVHCNGKIKIFLFLYWQTRSTASPFCVSQLKTNCNKHQSITSVLISTLHSYHLTKQSYNIDQQPAHISKFSTASEKRHITGKQKHSKKKLFFSMQIQNSYVMHPLESRN